MKNELVIFHYHLFPGGVTNVVMLSVRALLSHLPEVEHIRLVCGSERHVQSVKSHLTGQDETPDPRISCEVLPEIYYLPRDAAPGDPSLPDKEELKRTLRERFGGALWWVHNYQLGKNPVFTQALLEIAAESPQQRLLLHIHDFPECSRYDNLALLERFVTLPLYPISPNVRYALINQRDYALLTQAGVPSTHAFLLNNPVPADHVPPTDRGRVRRRLETAFAGRFPGYVDGAPFLFYPVRTIRRKNVLEAGLIARVAGIPLNLIVTLPGISEKEAPYSALVQGCFEQGLVPGLWGVGSHLSEIGVGFQELAVASDCVVSSSVQEGFGYLFIDGRRWRKPVIARYLDILEGITDVVDGEAAHFYRDLAVPVGPETRRRLRSSYRSRADVIAPHLHSGAAQSLHRAIDLAFSGETVDFSYLSVDDQRAVLETASRPQAAAEIASLNRDLLDAVVRLASAATVDISERIQAHFSLESFAHTVRSILQSFEEGVPAARGSSPPSDGQGIHEYLKAGFATLQYIRLLYE